MNIFESFKKKNLKEVMDKNKYTQEEQYDTVIQLTDLSLREIVFRSRDYLSEENFSKLEDMISKKDINEEDLAKINKFIIEKGMPEEIINKIIEDKVSEYSSLLDEIDDLK